MLTAYRTDDRDPLTISGRDPRNPASTNGKKPGFVAWQELNSSEAINVLRKFTGDDVELNHTPFRAKSLIDRLRTPVVKYDKEKKMNVETGRYYALNLMDLCRLIKSQKTRDSFWVSTDEGEGCGGYNAKFKYKMQFDDLAYHQDISPGLIHSDLKTIKQNKWVSLWLSQSHEIIAVQLKGSGGDEISFLTSIPLGCIKEFKPMERWSIPDWFPGKSQTPGWYLMPDLSKTPNAMGRVPPRIPARAGRVVPKF